MELPNRDADLAEQAMIIVLNSWLNVHALDVPDSDKSDLMRYLGSAVQDMRAALERGPDNVGLVVFLTHPDDDK